jgi:hypothetical protein
MSEAENTDVAVEETAQAVVEPEAEANVQEQAKEESPKADPQKANWEETRAVLKEMQRTNRELKEQLAKQQAPKPSPEPDVYSELGISKDDLSTGEHVGKIYKEIKELKKALQQQKSEETEERLRLKYPDFDAVLSTENVEYLLKNEPTLVKSIQNNPDPYVQAEAAYRLAKKFCPGEDVEAKENARKIEENQKKPMAASSVKKSGALDQAHMYTNDRVLSKEGREFYYKQMQEARKQAR